MDLDSKVGIFSEMGNTRLLKCYTPKKLDFLGAVYFNNSLIINFYPADIRIIDENSLFLLFFAIN